MDKNIQQPICQCKTSDAGSCAKDLGLDAIACRCACHVLQQPSVEDERRLPPLPEPRAIRAGHSFPKVYAHGYTADQVHEYVRAAIAALSPAAGQQAIRWDKNSAAEFLRELSDAAYGETDLLETIDFLNTAEKVRSRLYQQAIPEGWSRERYSYTTLFNAISSAITWKPNKTIEISVKAFEDVMLSATPTPSENLCTHEFIEGSNKVCSHVSVCSKCGELRAPTPEGGV